MSVVYFMRRESGEGPIKIGVSGYLETRRRQLSSDHRAPMTVLATAPGGYRDEGRIHRQFAHIRLEGEWFEPTAELMSTIATVARTGKLPAVSEADRDIVLARRYLSGETLQQIADDFDITRERVRQILRANAVPSLGYRASTRRKAAPITDFEREVAELYQAGTAPPRDLIERYGLTTSQLTVILLRTKARKKPRGYYRRRPDHDEIVAKVADLYRAGESSTAIARALGFPHQATIYRYLAESGVKARRTRTLADQAALISAYHSGLTQKQVAAQFQVHPKTVADAIKRAGARLPREETEARRIAAVRQANVLRVRPQAPQADTARAA